MLYLIVRWLINTGALFLAAYIIDGIEATSVPVLFIAAAILGLLNAVIRPILFWLTLPVTIVTLGLFLLVLNGLMLALTAWLTPGFTIATFLDAVLGALILSVVSLVTSGISRPLAHPKRAD
jgi:putative membrane protein